ncbi:MAG: fumarylacetoacetate hydrolase family protein [Proteobacteria bacterium]|nr:fumarylacetoacetate hydrolase family protein [Cystobacterineae bacterium]MCL2259397.1 fumarylacetoacetate hydrolase family protein [Cystobacterineae bacterium]MCL2314137.1 fumarylacetoacetate hydrolase family protein [Pseudomonadota bacterium]
MKRFARIQTSVGPRYALVEGRNFEVLANAPWTGIQKTGLKLPFSEDIILVPTEASKVVAVGRNNKKHAQEMGKSAPEEPLIFLISPSALNGHKQPIVLPRESNEVHHEAELALIIGKELKKADEQKAKEAIFGLTCFNDVTARDIQRREQQYTRAKNYDSFACVGPFIVAELAWEGLHIRCRVNGELRQDGDTSELIFSPPVVVAFISNIMTLFPGDIVVMGTLAGTSPITEGDVVEVDIEDVGVLQNPATAAST